MSQNPTTGDQSRHGPAAPPAPEPGGVSRSVAECRGLSQAHGSDGTNPSALTPGQRAALKWLIEGATVSAVAERLGVDRRTVGRWKKHARFVAEAQRLCAPAADAVVRRVAVNRVTPQVKRQRRSDAVRLRTEQLYDKLVAEAPRNYVWNGVAYDSREDYMAAIKQYVSRRW